MHEMNVLEYSLHNEGQIHVRNIFGINHSIVVQVEDEAEDERIRVNWIVFHQYARLKV